MNFFDHCQQFSDEYFDHCVRAWDEYIRFRFRTMTYGALTDWDQPDFKDALMMGGEIAR